MHSKHKLGFPILRDPGSAWAESNNMRFTLPDDLCEVYSSFGIELPEVNGDDSWRLPLPARIVVDGTGKILSIEADPDYTVRPEPEDTLKVLRELR